MSQRIFNSRDLINEAISQSKVGPLRKALLKRAFNNRPDLREELTGLVMEQCREDCLAMGMTAPVEGGVVDAVDWQKLIDLVMKYLPTIIQLILSLL